MLVHDEVHVILGFHLESTDMLYHQGCDISRISILQQLSSEASRY